MIDISKYTLRQLHMDVGFIRERWRTEEKILAAMKKYGATPEGIQETEKRVQEYKQDYEAVRDAINKGG